MWPTTVFFLFLCVWPTNHIYVPSSPQSISINRISDWLSLPSTFWRLQVSYGLMAVWRWLLSSAPAHWMTWGLAWTGSLLGKSHVIISFPSLRTIIWSAFSFTCTVVTGWSGSEMRKAPRRWSTWPTDRILEAESWWQSCRNCTCVPVLNSFWQSQSSSSRLCLKATPWTRALHWVTNSHWERPQNTKQALRPVRPEIGPVKMR